MVSGVETGVRVGYSMTGAALAAGLDFCPGRLSHHCLMLAISTEEEKLFCSNPADCARLER